MTPRDEFFETLNAINEENNKFRKVVLKEELTEEEIAILKEPNDSFKIHLEKLETYPPTMVENFSPEDRERVEYILEDVLNNIQIAESRTKEQKKVDLFSARSVMEGMFNDVISNAELHERIIKCKKYEAEQSKTLASSSDSSSSASIMKSISSMPLESKSSELSEVTVTTTPELAPKVEEAVNEEEMEELMIRIRRTRC